MAQNSDRVVIIADGAKLVEQLGSRTALPVEGGIPITVEGRIIGGIGVSGVHVVPDDFVAARLNRWGSDSNCAQATAPPRRFSQNPFSVTISASQGEFSLESDTDGG